MITAVLKSLAELMNNLYSSTNILQLARHEEKISNIVTEQTEQLLQQSWKGPTS